MGKNRRREEFELKFRQKNYCDFVLLQVEDDLKDISDKEEQMSRLKDILELTQEDYDERAKIARYIQVIQNLLKMYFIFSVNFISEFDK